jgi:zinc transport system permease protein
MVGVTARALGALPVFAFSTLPAIAALAFGQRLRWTFLIATALGAVAGGGGYLLATFRDFPVGGSQTATAGALVLIAIGAVAVVNGARLLIGRRRAARG